MFQHTKNLITNWLTSCCSRKTPVKEQQSNCDRKNRKDNSLGKNYKKNNINNRSRNGINDIKIERSQRNSFESSFNYLEYCEKTMLVADSGHHTKPTSYQPIEIKAKKCSSSNIKSASSSQTQTTFLATAAKKTATISLNNSLKKLPPISSFFNKNLLEKEALLSINSSQSTTTKPLSSSTTTSTTTFTTTTTKTTQPILSPSYKLSSKPIEFTNPVTPLNKVPTNKTTTLIIPTFRSHQHQQPPHQHYQIGSTSSISKQSSNELLRRLAQPNTIPPTTSHRIPNSDSTSNDSLNLEMCYFKPIKPVPITPPKKGSIVIKRPLPKRIKSKRRKCDVFIGPKKGQMPILFSTVTPFKRCSAFYSNNETTALKTQTEIPDLNLRCPLAGNIETNKNLIKGNQIVNNLSREVNEKSNNKFYLRKCYVILERSNLGICFKTKTKGKTKKNSQQKKDPVKITRNKNNSKNLQLKSNQVRKNVTQQTNKNKNSNGKNQYNSVNNRKLIEEPVKEKDIVLNESNVDFSNKNFIQSLNRRSNRNSSIIENLEQAIENKNLARTRKLVDINLILPNETKKLKQITSRKIDSGGLDIGDEDVDDVIEQKNSSRRNTRSSNNQLSDPKFQENNRITRRNSRKSLSVQENHFSFTEILTSPTKVKTKAAVKQIVPDTNFNEFLYQSQIATNQRVTRKRSYVNINDEINNKKLKIDKTIDKINNDLIDDTNDSIISDGIIDQQEKKQRITRKQKQLKEKTDLLKSDYEFALKLQMQLELEVFPIEPVANRTRNTRSRMNISCDDISENSSSVGLLNQNNYRYNNNLNNNDDDSDDNDNDDDNKTLSSLKNKIIRNKMEIEGLSGKLSKTVKKTIIKKGGTAKSFKSSFAPLKG